MGTLAFRTHDAQTIAAQVEERLREETGSNARLSFRIEAQTPSAGFTAPEVYRSLFGGRSTPNRLFVLHFDIEQPRRTTLDIDINKQHLTAYAGSLIYAAPLTRSLNNEVHLEMGKTPLFAGDTNACARLNANSELLERSGKFARKTLMVGALAVHIELFLRLIPQDGQVWVVAHTLPKSVKLGFGSILDAREWLEIVARIEAAL